MLLARYSNNQSECCLHTGGIGNWTTEGCVTSGAGPDSTGIVTCSCSHLTNFAVQVVSNFADMIMISIYVLLMTSSIFNGSSEYTATSLSTDPR